ncbi:hypothetical protein [Coxiella burnetii]|uniref:Uncharacterized protein n=1 Tax=Coxiella burnetii (strain RSA 493 / Nine Mile phase I) TaxID=227377 RepID=Q83AP8_COXBU|nr:hypothetical protein [Coxiella burnetii]NP_820812.1 hypothetical protein CBU_1833 [Coxiella burnetii RSA 493]AAO91326.1 hypothetical protein CBU_1833 [Coxiella burnetii RSA 493]AML48273.1 hypothetical protein AUR58_03065 [Coxiella burnetii]AML54287.1 hypothetical protein AYM38_02690 [Coxiella burnetii]ARI66585.1 hypothetical protein B7L74_09430 [Coxiella burnetii]ARK28026.1 hypothetical protein BMW92_09175 [Coxiella burnetii]
MQQIFTISKKCYAGQADNLSGRLKDDGTKINQPAGRSEVSMVGID